MIPLEIYTCRVQDHRRLKSEGVEWLDTTVKTGASVFKPTWSMVMGWKNKEITDDQYTVMYRQLMERSWQENKDVWLQTLETDRLVLGCFCPPDTFCHRRLLAKMMVKVAQIHLGRMATYHGEIVFNK